MYRRILLATDGSQAAALALAQAVRLAADYKAELRVVNVLDMGSVQWAMAGGYPLDIQPVIDALRAEGQQALDKAKARAAELGVTAETLLFDKVDPGQRVAQSIADEAKKWGADLIVMGTHGRRGVSHLVLGSVAESVLRLASAPVLLVRAAGG